MHSCYKGSTWNVHSLNSYLNTADSNYLTQADNEITREIARRLGFDWLLFSRHTKIKDRHFFYFALVSTKDLDRGLRFAGTLPEHINLDSDVTKVAIENIFYRASIKELGWPGLDGCNKPNNEQRRRLELFMLFGRRTK